MIPEKSQGKVLQATVVAVGSGARGKVITLKHSSWVEPVMVWWKLEYCRRSGTVIVEKW